MISHLLLPKDILQPTTEPLTPRVGYVAVWFEQDLTCLCVKDDGGRVRRFNLCELVKQG